MGSCKHGEYVCVNQLCNWTNDQSEPEYQRLRGVFSPFCPVCGRRLVFRRYLKVTLPKPGLQTG